MRWSFLLILGDVDDYNFLVFIIFLGLKAWLIANMCSSSFQSVSLGFYGCISSLLLRVVLTRFSECRSTQNAAVIPASWAISTMCGKFRLSAAITTSAATTQTTWCAEDQFIYENEILRAGFWILTDRSS